jgi:hypothetical protein
VTNGPKTSYNGLQLSLNRRFTRGVQFDVNYTYGKGYMDQFYSFHRPYQTTEMNYTNISDRSPSGNASGNVRHVFVGNWVYELPFGRGQRFGSGANRWLNHIIGDWSFQGLGRIQSGRMLDYGNVRLVGMSVEDLHGAFQSRKATDPQNKYRTLVYMLPDDIVQNTIKAFSVNASGYSAGAPTGRYIAPANSPGCIERIVPSTNSYNTNGGFGDCGVRSLIVTGPKVMRVDFNIVKRIRVSERVWLEGQAQIFNVFNNVNFNPVGYAGSVSDSFQVTGAIDQSRTMQLAFRISF